MVALDTPVTGMLHGVRGLDYRFVITKPKSDSKKTIHSDASPPHGQTNLRAHSAVSYPPPSKISTPLSDGLSAMTIRFAIQRFVDLSAL